MQSPFSNGGSPTPDQTDARFAYFPQVAAGDNVATTDTVNVVSALGSVSTTGGKHLANTLGVVPHSYLSSAIIVGVRCSSVVRAFAHGAMGRRIDPSWSGSIELFSRSNQCSTTGVTKAVVCAILCGMVHIKETLLLIGKSSPCGGSGFPLSLSVWSFTICLTPYNCK